MKKVICALLAALTVCCSAPVFADKVDDCMAMGEAVLNIDFKDTHTVSRSGNDVYFSFWHDDVAREVYEAAQGNAAYLETYGQMISGLQAMSKTLTGFFTDAGLDNINVYTVVLNDLNTDSILVVYEDGKLEYDVVNGYHAPQTR